VLRGGSRRAAAAGFEKFDVMDVGYWYVSFEDGTTQFFCDEKGLTEEQWRAEAPKQQVAEFDDHQQSSNAPLFPKDVAAS
jgi:hypothetical protein